MRRVFITGKCQPAKERKINIGGPGYNRGWTEHASQQTFKRGAQDGALMVTPPEQNDSTLKIRMDGSVILLQIPPSADSEAAGNHAELGRFE